MTTVVTGVDRRGDPVTLTGTGELSRVLQHETDHLRGVLLIDRLTGQDRKDALRQLRGAAGPIGPLSGAAG
jgi:peptide deformylase